MKDGIYFEVFAVKDGKRYNAKIVDLSDVSKIIATAVLDGLGEVIGFEEHDHPTEKGGGVE